MLITAEIAFPIVCGHKEIKKDELFSFVEVNVVEAVS